MKVGIIILNYNSFDLTRKLSNNCLDMSGVDKVIIVDNASSDNFDEYVKSVNSDKLVYIKNTNNSGYASGNNIGLRYLYEHGYDIAFIANPDVWFNEDVIVNISQFLASNQEYAVCSCRRTGYNLSRTRQFWWIPSKKQAILESLHFMRSYYTKKHEKDSYIICENYSNKQYIDVEVVGGAFFGANLKILNQVDYFESDTFLWYEENILAYKLSQINKKEALLLNCVYNHNHIHKGHGNKKINIYLNSKRVFCYKYLKINFFEKILMRVLDFIGIIEEKSICFISNFFD